MFFSLVKTGLTRRSTYVPAFGLHRTAQKRAAKLALFVMPHLRGLYFCPQERPASELQAFCPFRVSRPEIAVSHFLSVFCDCFAAFGFIFHALLSYILRQGQF